MYVDRMVVVSSRDSAVMVDCPYSKSFTDFAHMRGGLWSDGSKRWMFDSRDEFAVRATLIDIYGTDDSASCQKVDVRLSLDGMRDRVDGTGRLFICGREVARRRYCARYVDLGESVVIVTGGFPREADYRGRPILAPEAATVLEVRGVPVQAAERARSKYPEAVTLLGGYDLEALRVEREFHATRIAALDALIAGREAATEVDDLADLEDTDDGSPDGCSGEAAEG